MKRVLLLIFAILALTAVARASWNTHATCPQDGARAYFRDAKATASGDMCKYSHTFDDNGKEAQHEFWRKCE